MSKTKKIIALLLALVLCFSVAAVPVSAASPETLSASDNGVQNFFYMVIDRLIQVILSFLNQCRCLLMKYMKSSSVQPLQSLP